MQPHHHHINHTPMYFNPLNAELNSICHLLTLLGAHHILHISRIRFNLFSKKNYGNISSGFTDAGEALKIHRVTSAVINIRVRINIFRIFLYVLIRAADDHSSRGVVPSVVFCECDRKSSKE